MDLQNRGTMNKQFIKTTLINGTEYTFRLMTLNEFKEVINSKATGNLGTYLGYLLTECFINPKIDLNEVPKALGELLLLNLWVYSVSGIETSVLDIDGFCNECGHVRPATVNLQNSYVLNSNQESTQEPQDYDISHKLTEYTELLMEYPKVFQDSDKIDMVINSIVGVNVIEQSGSTTQIKIEDFSEDDKNSLLSLISLDALTQIIEKLEQSKCISIMEFKSSVCPGCGDGTQVVPLVGLSEIMRGA